MSLRASFFATFVIFILICSMAVLVHGRSVTRIAHETHLQARAQLQAEALAGALAGEVNTVFSALRVREERISQALAPDNSAMQNVSPLLDAFVQADPGILWMGVARLDGRLVATSDRISIGSNISEAAWFRSGIMDRHIGAALEPDKDFHAAVPVAGTAQRHAVPLVTPLRDEAGETAAVLVMLADLTLQDARFAALAERLGVDAALVSSDGRVVLGEASQTITPALEAARLGEARTTLLRGTGEMGEQVIALHPLDISELRTRPQLTIVTAAPASQPYPAFARDALAALLGCLGVAVLIALLYARIVVRPIATLATQAEDILAEKEIYPAKGTGSREAAALESALLAYQQNQRSEQSR